LQGAGLQTLLFNKQKSLPMSLPQGTFEHLAFKGKSIISAIRGMEIVDKTDKVTWYSFLKRNFSGITELEQDFLYQSDLSNEVSIVRALLPDATKAQICYIFATHSFRDFLFNQAACLLVGARNYSHANANNDNCQQLLIEDIIPDVTTEEYRYIQNEVKFLVL
jgi:hypothetical protein